MQIDTGIVLIIWQSKGVSKYVRVCGGRLLDPQFSKSIFGLIHPCLIHIIGSLLTLLVLCAIFWRWKDRTLLKKAWTGKKFVFVFNSLVKIVLWSYGQEFKNVSNGIYLRLKIGLEVINLWTIFVAVLSKSFIVMFVAVLILTTICVIICEWVRGNQFTMLFEQSRK